MKTIEKTTGAAKAITAPKLVSIEEIRYERKVIEKWKLIKLRIPEDYALMLCNSKGYCIVCSASVHQGLEQSRITRWSRGGRMQGGGSRPSKKSDLEAILKMDLNTLVSIPIRPDAWKAIGTVCKALGITKAEWLLASVRYNGELALGTR